MGFALCTAGLVLVQASAIEHENDRVHALIRTLPGPVADVVERLLPEEEWRDQGLHGLPERQLARRIEALVSERMRRQDALRRALDPSRLLGLSNPGGFAGEIQRAITDESQREPPR